MKTNMKTKRQEIKKMNRKEKTRHKVLQKEKSYDDRSRETTAPT